MTVVFWVAAPGVIAGFTALDHTRTVVQQHGLGRERTVAVEFAALVRPAGGPLRLHRPVDRPAQHPSSFRGAHVGAHRQQRGLHRRPAVVPPADRRPVPGRRRGPPRLGGPARPGDHLGSGPPGRAPGDDRPGGGSVPAPLAVEPPPRSGPHRGAPGRVDLRLRAGQPDHPVLRPGAGRRGVGAGSGLLLHLRLHLHADAVRGGGRVGDERGHPRTGRAVDHRRPDRLPPATVGGAAGRAGGHPAGGHGDVPPGQAGGGPAVRPRDLHRRRRRRHRIGPGPVLAGPAGLLHVPLRGAGPPIDAAHPGGLLALPGGERDQHRAGPGPGARAGRPRPGALPLGGLHGGRRLRPGRPAALAGPAGRSGHLGPPAAGCPRHRGYGCSGAGGLQPVGRPAGLRAPTAGGRIGGRGRRRVPRRLDRAGTAGGGPGRPAAAGIRPHLPGGAPPGGRDRAGTGHRDVGHTGPTGRGWARVRRRAGLRRRAGYGAGWGRAPAWCPRCHRGGRCAWSARAAASGPCARWDRTMGCGRPPGPDGWGRDGTGAGGAAAGHLAGPDPTTPRWTATPPASPPSLGGRTRLLPGTPAVPDPSPRRAGLPRRGREAPCPACVWSPTAPAT